MTERPRCLCHDKPMYPNNSNGGWRCAVKTRNRDRPGNLDYYHRADGGYIRRRKRHLAQQRDRVLEQLDQLDQEATECSVATPATRRS